MRGVNGGGWDEGEHEGCGIDSQRALENWKERKHMSEFRPIISIGFDKNGEADFRINMSIAEVDRPKMEELTKDDAMGDQGSS